MYCAADKMYLAVTVYPQNVISMGFIVTTLVGRIITYAICNHAICLKWAVHAIVSIHLRMDKVRSDTDQHPVGKQQNTVDPVHLRIHHKEVQEQDGREQAHNLKTSTPHNASTSQPHNPTTSSPTYSKSKTPWFKLLLQLSNCKFAIVRHINIG